ncbi:hypothetical protein [Clostridium sp.]|jgi:phenylalanyl-tRNA synthetase alpha subunit|uniref:hypothetical protein n=1 Tax=Clostridium sp. TaxID=1506 RepID=UPI003A42C416
MEGNEGSENNINKEEAKKQFLEELKSKNLEEKRKLEEIKKREEEMKKKQAEEKKKKEEELKKQEELKKKQSEEEKSKKEESTEKDIVVKDEEKKLVKKDDFSITKKTKRFKIPHVNGKLKSSIIDTAFTGVVSVIVEYLMDIILRLIFGYYIVDKKGMFIIIFFIILILYPFLMSKTKYKTTLGEKFSGPAK